MSFYILQDKDEFDTGLPMGYSIIQADKDSAPEGVKLLTEKQLENAVSSLDKANEKLIDSLGSPSVNDLKGRYTVKQLKAIAKTKDIKVSGNEEKIINTLLEAGVEL